METRNEKTDKMPINRVILMSCGRYNPPTFMHLRMFERARDHLHTLQTHRVVGGIVSPINDFHSSEDLTRSTTRCDLLKAALRSSDWIYVSTWEVRQYDVKSTRETLEHHQSILNSYLNNDIDNNLNNEDIEWIPESVKDSSDRSPIQIKLLCGADLLESLSTAEPWSEDDIQEIVGNYGLVVIGKEEGNPNKCIYNSDILSRNMNNIYVVTEWIPNEVNSTRIRRALRRGESVKYLLNNAVIELIYRYGIYDAKWMSANTIPTSSLAMDKSAMISTTPTGAAAAGTAAGDKAQDRVILMSCGSYNPPTHMHLRMFERARDHLHNLGSHIVIGGAISPVNDAYGKKELASGAHRREMLKLALQDSDWIKLSTWELRQPGWTRTKRSLQHHQSLLNTLVHGWSDDCANSNEFDNEDLDWLPNAVRNNDVVSEPIGIKLLCGGDLLESFATPGLWAEKDIAEIVGQYGLIVITREGSNPYKFIYDSDILSKHSHNIQIVTEWIPNEVSSTRIRRALKRGESVKYLLQDPVIDYIYKNGIYDAKRPSTTKLEFSSIHSSTDYLDADEAKYHDNAFLTPSPSDVTMRETSPCCNANQPSLATTTTNEAALPDSVLQKNMHNNSSQQQQQQQRHSGDKSSNSITENTAREKFFRSLINDLDGESSSSLLLLQGASSSRIFGQQLELPSSARARNELLAFEDTESELATLCGDNTYSEEREEDVLSTTYEESSEDLNESSVRNRELRGKANSDTSSTTREGPDLNESALYDTLEDSDSQATKLETNYEIDGKYVKSVVKSRKQATKQRYDDSEEEELRLAEVASTPETEDAKTIEEKVKEPMKLFEDDISYIKRLRLIINSSPQQDSSSKRQGSLDSINLNESQPFVRESIERSSMSKKSKSFESIKRNASSTYCEAAPMLAGKPVSDSTSQLVTAREFDNQTEEYCSACSPEEEEDSTECDICSSCNLRDPNDPNDPKDATTAPSMSEEICEICGEPASLADEPPLVLGSRSLNLPKAKSTIEIYRGGAYRRSRLDDDRFEIDNCGQLEGCRLRASLDTCCNKPEPLYVNVMPRQQFVRHSKSDYQPYSESECLNRGGRVMYQEVRYAPKDELAMSRSLSIGGTKRTSRKSSYSKKSGSDKAQERRRYSSVDNLQNRTHSFRATGEKFSKSRDNKFMVSADSIRPRVSRSRSLRRSADNVGRFDSSGDNLDSLEETADNDENGTDVAAGRYAIRDNDTIKMILTKHGIKIISQKETVL